VLQLLLTAALVLAAASGAAAAWALWQLVLAVRVIQDREVHDRSVRLMALFAPGIAATVQDARALLTWQPLAATARKLFPEECAALDRASGMTFPFSAEQIQAAHSRWTADWLAWEETHDSVYKLKAAEIEATLQMPGGSPAGRARLDAVEREKLARYQQRYEEYVRVGKALQAFLKGNAP
jgi:hypothetical protein